jgi:hypothetical protein
VVEGRAQPVHQPITAQRVAAPHHPALAPQVVIRGISGQYVMLFFRTMVDVIFSSRKRKMCIYHNEKDPNQILFYAYNNLLI